LNSEVVMQAGPPDEAPASDGHGALALYTDEEARAIWARAATLHAEAGTALRREYGLSALPDQPLRPHRDLPVPPAGMFLGHEIVAAALEAGIDPAHLAVAIAEHDAAERETSLVPTDAQRQLFIRELGTDAGSVRSVAFVPGEPARVIAQMRDAFSREPWGLRFDGVVPAASDVGQVLRFRVPMWLEQWDDSGRLPPNFTNAFVYNANRIGVLTLHVLLVPRGTADAPGCEVSVVADLRLGQHFNARTMRWLHRALTVVLVAAGAQVGMAVATPDAALLSVPALAGAITGGLGAFGMQRLGRGIVRWEQRTAMRVLAREFRRLLDAIGRPATRDTRGSATSVPLLRTPDPSSPARPDHELHAAYAN
jgi:hypothetical protein